MTGIRKALLVAVIVLVALAAIYLFFAIGVNNGGSEGAGASESRIPNCSEMQNPKPERFANVRPEQVAVCGGGSIQ